MGKMITQRFRASAGFFRNTGFLLVLLASLVSLTARAQTTITTTGTSFDGANSGGSPGAVTFGVENSNTNAILITQVASFLYSSDPASVFTLWYHPTQLTGAPGAIGTAGGWVQIASGSSVSPPSTNGIATVISGMTFTMPANTTYRFALTSASSTIHYSGSAAITPNTFTTGGVSLLVSGNTTTPGYAGTITSPVNTPRAFTGSITFIPAIACTGTPTAAITSTATSACPNTPFVLNATPAAATGYTYQFQVSTNGGTTWTNLGTASSNPSYPIANQTASSQYRVTVTCSGTGGGSNTSPAVTVTQSPTTACYCTPGSNSATYYISNFSTTGGGTNITNNTNGQSPNGYGQFLSQAVSQLQSQSINFSVTHGPSGYTYGFGIWVDWNQNGSFLDAGEKVFTSSGGSYATNHSGSFTVPLSAPAGSTRMRIGQDYLSTTGPSDPCMTTYGEFEDYTFNVIALTPCTGTPAGGTASASPASVCPNATTLLTAPGSTIAGNLAFQWKYFNTVTSTWDPVIGGSGATTNNYTTGPIGVSTQFRLDITCTPSGITSSSTPVTVNVSAYAPPYLETFESVTTDGQMPNCMSTSNTRQYSSDGWWTYTANNTYAPYNQINHTTGGSKYATMYYYNKNEWIFTPGLTLQAGKTYQMKFWYITPNGSSIFSAINVGAGTAALGTAMTVFGTIPNPSNTTYQQGIFNFVCTANGTYNFGINGVAGTSGSGYPGITVDDIEVYELPPCSGRPVAGTIVRTPSAACPGTRVNLTLSGSSIASGLSYLWQQSPGTGGGPWVTAPGTSNSDAYLTPTIGTATNSYRLIITCANGGQKDTSAVHVITPYAPVLPYLETFESIVSNNQLPNCMQATSLGSNVTTYAGGTATSGTANHTPSGSKYAVIYDGYLLDNWLFTSKIPLVVGKTYKFSYWYRSSTTSPNVKLQAAVGTGPNAALMQSYITTNLGANTTYVQTSGTYKALSTGDYVFGINMVGTTTSPSYGYISIDDILVEELPPCTGAPTVNITPRDSITLCPTATVDFTSPQPVNSGLTYQWQYSPDPTFPNTSATVNILNANNFTFSGPALPITAYYRLKTYCTKQNGVDSAYSNVVKVIVKPTLYAPVPYVNDFENWVDYCDSKDVPSGGNWVQTLKTGNSSWRRNDQGSTAAWTSPTSGAYTPAAKSGTYSARFHSSNATPSVLSGPPEEGQLDMYLNCSGTDTNKTLYFYHINPPGVNSVTNVSLSTDGGLTFNQIAGYDTAAGWRLRVVPFQSDRPATIIRFSGRRTSTNTSSDIGIDSVYVAPPCVGQPVAGTIGTNSPANICPGDTAVFNLSGTSFAGNLLIEWQASTTSATAGFSTYQSTFGNYRWSTPPLLQTTWVRARVVCRGSGLESYSNVIQLDATTAPAPAYAALPFTENFENWTSRCSNTDIPSANWTNVPNTGNRSWRRNDQGNTAAWTSLIAGQWWPGLPAAAVDTYAARFHNAAATPNGSTGTLYNYIDCSSVAGDKELRFFVNMPNRTSGNADSLQVSYSRDGGLRFTRLGVVRSTAGWEQKVFVLPSDSAKTVIRFQATSQTTQQDIGIDYVQVLPPCSGAPIAGTVDSVADVCPSRPFRLSVSNISQAGNLSYTWERSTASPTTGFTAIAGATTPYFSTSITQNTWFRLRVRCGQDSTYTAARLVKLADFYYCYCQTNPQYPITATQFGENIGNVTVRNSPSGNVLLTNGIASPVSSNPTAVNAYSNFQNLPAVPMYRDSTYRVDIQQISYATNNAATVAGWIDFNRDGVFDPLTERVLNLTTSGSGTTPYRVSGTFQVPSNATPGLTGLRLTLMSPTGTPAPCGQNAGYGETEDYLIELRFAPCSGFSSVNAGTASISDTAICLGYPVTLWDTSYQKEIYGITRQWQRTVNNGASWQNIGTPNTDTISTIVQANSGYRYTMFCNNGAQSYSNVVNVGLRPSTECYCPSFATGGTDGKRDSSDIGSVSISSYTFQQGGAGPHLLNPAATKKWTNHADNSQIIHLWADSAYELDVYHIIRGATHKDAKVTVFIDYNQDLSFQVNPPAGYPSERILTAYTAANNYYLDNMAVRIPAQQVIQNVPTLMRIILNEDTGPSVASDEGCGTYLSGETEDFRVMFHCAGCPLGVNTASNVSSFNLFPNPTTGTSKLELNTQVAIKEVEMTVTTMTGQVLQKKSFSNVGTRFETIVDLKEHARGVYFVELKADNERIVRKLIVQ
ncbi:MAG: T9SS type A sorting domain-containing protein [Sphingobacteriales bacterium]|nr:MAG: T9SS type A sorting domain-containing protein [Sphingobacteriales bacterium]